MDLDLENDEDFSKDVKDINWKNRIRRKGFFGSERFELWFVEEIYKEQRLWRKVLDRALLDSIGSDQELIDESVFWFAEFDPSFQKVCEYAGIPPTIVHGTALWLLKTMGVDSPFLPTESCYYQLKYFY